MKLTYKLILCSLISLPLTGCSGLLTSRISDHDGISMQQAYQQAINGQSHALSHIRKTIKRPMQFIRGNSLQRLANPNITLYVFPHQVGSGANLTPIPGYSTEFPLYEHIYYALPGESQ